MRHLEWQICMPSIRSEMFISNMHSNQRMKRDTNRLNLNSLRQARLWKPSACMKILEIFTRLYKQPVNISRRPEMESLLIKQEDLFKRDNTPKLNQRTLMQENQSSLLRCIQIWAMGKKQLEQRESTPHTQSNR